MKHFSKIIPHLYLIDICLYVSTCTENLKNLRFGLCNGDLLFRNLCKIFKSDFFNFISSEG